ncbi:MAG: PepSY domain-containing protein [Candidatus Saliniplasma sp.]
MRDKMRYIHIIVIMILLLTSLSGCIEINSDKEKETMTALQAYNIAKEIANEQYDDSILVLVGLGGYSDGKGGAYRWSFRCYSPSTLIIEDNVSYYQRMYIYVYADDNTENQTRYITKSSFSNPIENWTIDSDEAVEIAKQEPQIESYLDEYPGASLGMTLKMWEKLPDGRENPNQSSATWSIGWSDSGGYFGDPAHARVFINANTGEVLYVDADI